MLAVSKHLADNELMGIGDHFIDFSAGSNEFAPMLASATGCTFQSFDLFPPKVRENFVQKNWFSVSSHDVCVEMKDKEMVLGLNPPFGLNNQQSKKFVTHGIQKFPATPPRAHRALSWHCKVMRSSTMTLTL